MNLTTFGLELEVATEAPALVRHLHDEGHIPYPSMHRWHCECDDCMSIQDNGFLFKAQTDSSCSGEVITRILHHDPTDYYYDGDVFDILQEATLAVDAEPGLQAGMHVHVGVNHLNATQQGAALWAFMRWESQLRTLAAGRWANNRDGNQNVVGMLRHILDPMLDRDERGGNRVHAIEAKGLADTGMHYLALDHHRCNDRHSNLNVATGHGTFEYRLWNSTRSAWRMEMYTRVSVALVDPNVVAKLLTCPVDLDRFCVELHNAGHEQAAELAYRQVTYLNERAYAAPSSFTNF